LIIAISALRIRDLFIIAMLFGIYSLLTASLFMNLDAVDVAFTEAAVGSGISTILLLATLKVVGRYESAHKKNSIVSLIIVIVTGAVLVYGLQDAPLIGNQESPAHLHVAPSYIEEAYNKTGVPNLVTAVLASYRGFDTLGEVVVVFTAGLSIILLLGASKTDPVKDYGSISDQNIQKIVTKIIIPFILIFALYVQFHGDYGAGGGFQAGVIFSSGIIIYDLVFGNQFAKKIIPSSLLVRLASLGVLLFGITGLLSLLEGKEFLNYSALSEDPIHGQHLGIILIEFGIGLTVFSVISLIYFAFSTRRIAR